MWKGPEIQLASWGEFIPRLRAELSRLGLRRQVLVRNFELETCTIDQDGEMGEMVNRLDLVHATGTDRDKTSWMWNADGHDWDHDLQPSGRDPQHIIYAYPVDAFRDPPVVIWNNSPVEMDLTASLDDQHGILIYDPLKLKQVSKNEHWFEDDPLDALLMIFTLAPQEEEQEEEEDDKETGT